MKVLDLFSGIGGFSLGLERAGMKTVAFCEIDLDCRKVLRRHWPATTIYHDIKMLSGKFIEVDVICGGFPCIGHSVAGKKEGFKNEQSNLWHEYLRLIREIKPKYCIIENSPNLRNTGLVEMLKALDEIGYDAEWSVVSAYSVGSPHQRERLYIVLWRRDLPYCNPFRFWQADTEKEKASCWWWSKRLFKRSSLFGRIGEIKPTILRSPDGIQQRLDENRIKQLGNTVLPQIPELIGRAIMESQNE